MHLAILYLRGCHVLNCIRQGNATGEKHIERQFDILTHFEWVTVMLVMDKLAHLRLILSIAGDHCNQVAERDPITKVRETRDQQATCIVE